MPKVPPEPGSHDTLQQSHGQTRANQAAKQLLTSEELMKILKESMETAEHARDYLNKQGYTLKDVQGDRATLSHTLLLLAHHTPSNILLKGVRAVATILEQETIVKMADMVIANVMAQLNPIFELMDNAALIS